MAVAGLAVNRRINRDAHLGVHVLNALYALLRHAGQAARHRLIIEKVPHSPAGTTNY